MDIIEEEEHAQQKENINDNYPHAYSLKNNDKKTKNSFENGQKKYSRKRYTAR